MPIEVSTPAAEGNSQSTHLSLHMAQYNSPHAMPAIHKNPHCVNRQPWGYGEESTRSKAKIMFPNLLAFHVSSPHKNKFSLLNPTNSFNIIIPVGFFLPRGFFSQKKHLFRNICNTREARGCLSIFTTMAHFWRQVFVPLQKHHLLLKAISVGFCDQIPVVCMFYAGQYNHWNKSQL